jgi:hypothetical protein
MGGTDVELGQTDDDPALEIGVTNEHVQAHVIDGSSGSVQWSVVGGIGLNLAFGDLNDDHRDEIIGANRNNGLVVYDVFNDVFLWDLQGNGIDALLVADVQGDAGLEVLYGDNQWGEIHLLDSEGAEIWSFENPELGVSELAIGDGDGDGAPEIYWGGSHSFLMVADRDSHLIEWSSQLLKGPFLGLDTADIDGDGEDEDLVTVFEQDDDDFGKYLIFDSTTHVLEYESEPFGLSPGGAWEGLLVNIDSDPQLEICVSAVAIYCFDGLSHEQQLFFAPPAESSFFSLSAGPIAGDGIMRLVAGGFGGVDNLGGHVFAIDPLTGVEFWRSPSLGADALLQLLAVADVTGDSTPEVVTGDHDEFLAILDGATGAIKLPPTTLPVKSLRTVAGSGPTESIQFGTNQGQLRALDPVSGATSLIATLPPGRVNAVDGGSINGRDFVAVVVNGALYLYEDLGNGPIDSIFLGSESGAFGSLFVGRDGRIRLNTGSGVADLAVVLADHLFEDGFESGDTQAWSE